MRALIFHGPGDVRLEEVPRPEPGPGDALVRVEVALTGDPWLDDVACWTFICTIFSGNDTLMRSAHAPQHEVPFLSTSC